MSSAKYSTLQTRTFAPPDSREWHSLSINIQSLSIALEKLNEEKPEKNSPDMEQWKESHKEICRLLVEAHEQKIKILQSCYK